MRASSSSTRAPSPFVHTSDSAQGCRHAENSFVSASASRQESAHPQSPDGVAMLKWTQWQKEVVAILQRDLEGTLNYVGVDDVDWPAWEHLFREGRSPRAAVDRAFERDL